MPVKVKERRRVGGVISDRTIFEDAVIFREKGERLTSYGYFNLYGKRYIVSAYFPTRRYWWRLAHNIPTHISSIVFPSAYLKGKRIDELVRGVRVYDERSHFVRYERNLYLGAFRAVRIWIRVYLDPFYPPRPNYFDAKLKVLRKITEVSKRRQEIKLREALPEFYIEQIRKADEQMLLYLATLEKRNDSLRTLTSTLISVSDAPASVNMDDLLRKARRFEALLEELEGICEQRAKSWPDAELARTALSDFRQRKENLVKRYGPRALLDGIVGVVFGVLSGGSLAVGFLFSVSSELGIGFLRDFILGPKHQVERLLEEAKSYRRAVERVRDFVALYRLRPQQDAFRV
ncbi:MAG: hypothetical protein JRN72_04540 [Nitrososphaerota archaeon]|nr:hypothetical protein [Nitrososphaerota archaeon]MDG6949367.1 hypothetical protein [Nitrososphaerota archaeon]